MSGKKKYVADGPMSRLEELVQKAGIRLKSQENAPPPTPPVPPKPKPVSPEGRETDEEAFLNAMDGINRVSWRHDPHSSSKPPRAPDPDPELEGRRLMEAAIDEDIPITIPDHPEYIEGWVGIAGKKFLPNLRNGLYSIQGQIDLHGMNQEEARIAVEDYIARMSRFRSCCVKIIHGRGINSPADRATLKDNLQRLLSTRRMAKYVVAYASAPYRDGGVGAVYVLLCSNDRGHLSRSL